MTIRRVKPPRACLCARCGKVLNTNDTYIISDRRGAYCWDCVRVYVGEMEGEQWRDTTCPTDG